MSSLNNRNRWLSGASLVSDNAPPQAGVVIKTLQEGLDQKLVNLSQERPGLKAIKSMTFWIGRGQSGGDLGSIVTAFWNSDKINTREFVITTVIVGIGATMVKPPERTINDQALSYTDYMTPSRSMTAEYNRVVAGVVSQRVCGNLGLDSSEMEKRVSVVSSFAINNELWPLSEPARLVDMLVNVHYDAAIVTVSQNQRDFMPPLQEYADNGQAIYTRLNFGYFDGTGRDGSFRPADVRIDIYLGAKNMAMGQTNEQNMMLLGSVFALGSQVYSPIMSAGRQCQTTWVPKIVITEIQSEMGATPYWFLFLLSQVTLLGAGGLWKGCFGYSMPEQLRNMCNPAVYAMEAPMNASEQAQVVNNSFIRAELPDLSSGTNYAPTVRLLLDTVFHQQPVYTVRTSPGSPSTVWARCLGGDVAYANAVTSFIASAVGGVEIRTTLGLASDADDKTVAQRMASSCKLIDQADGQSMMGGIVTTPSGERIPLSRVMDYRVVGGFLNADAIPTYGAMCDSGNHGMALSARMTTLQRVMPEMQAQVLYPELDRRLNMDALNMLVTMFGPIQVTTLGTSGADQILQANSSDGRRFMNTHNEVPKAQVSFTNVGQQRGTGGGGSSMFSGF
jgi:hypothetical protein